MQPTDEEEREETQEDVRSEGRTEAPPRRRRPTAKAPPILADPHALALVQDAAKAVGLDVESLANLMVDGGICALPPSDGITGTYTLEDLGKRLWATTSQLPRSQRAQWFAGLAPTQQTAVIVVLRDKGYASMTIAHDLGTSMSHVNDEWAKHSDHLGAQVVQIRLNTIAGNVQSTAERAKEMAMKKGDAAAVWRIEKELTQVLQSIGIVDKAIHKVEVTHKFDEQKQHELDALLAVERKKVARQEEIKLVTAGQDEGDDVPQFEEYDT